MRPLGLVLLLSTASPFILHIDRIEAYEDTVLKKKITIQISYCFVLLSSSWHGVFEGAVLRQ